MTTQVRETKLSGEKLNESHPASDSEAAVGVPLIYEAPTVSVGPMDQHTESSH
jgi:hypothetical protein